MVIFFYDFNNFEFLKFIYAFLNGSFYLKNGKLISKLRWKCETYTWKKAFNCRCLLPIGSLEVRNFHWVLERIGGCLWESSFDSLWDWVESRIEGWMGGDLGKERFTHSTQQWHNSQGINHHCARIGRQDGASKLFGVRMRNWV